MSTVLHWREFSGGRPYHAALVPFAEFSPPATAHSHADFHELLYLTSGSGVQKLGSELEQSLSTGDLVLVRPQDDHEFIPAAATGCEFINIAFASQRWLGFLDYGEVAAAAWDTATAPVVVQHAEVGVGEAMTNALASYQRQPRWVDLIRLWTAVIPALESASAATDERPPWLAAACVAMYAEENLIVGLPRLRKLAAVSEGHLARSMATFLSCSPVEFVNRVRLDHAANLLAVTTDPIGVIAQRCGFSSQAYFGGRFHQRFGVAPGQYRNRARRAVVP